MFEIMDIVWDLETVTRLLFTFLLAFKFGGSGCCVAA